MINYQIISTGSKGNAVVIEDIILIDCGVPFSKLENVFSKLQIVLLTHIHSDHFNARTIRKLHKTRPALRFVCCEWLLEPLIEAGISRRQIDVVKVGSKYSYGGFSISPVLLYHNVKQCGYRVYIKNQKVFYATDTNTLEGITAEGYDLYLIEANYEDNEIQERIAEKTEKGEYAYEYEVLKNHLSLAKAEKFIADNIKDNGVYVLIHGHGHEAKEVKNE